MVLLLALVRPSGIWRQHGTTKPWEVIMSEMLSIYHRLEGRVLAMVGGGRWSQSQRQQQPVMKAGWVGESGDMFLRPTQPPNPYSRRIAG
ncbi:BnaA02g23970D [Brassica napus]|uniref:BnaA02g23970D protein n=2 Tax=Brassica TaxID=3705 RepID=A0A078GNX9_BRANA|nr:BnaA02g23970D [Brassica napus]